jgi:hypothetical protein
MSDAQQTQLEPVTAHKVSNRAYKPKRTLKAPTTQSAIMTRRALGQSKRQISKELGVAVNTVTNVLELNDFDAKLTDGRSLCAELIPASVRVVKHRLAQNSENAAFKLLEGIGVLGRDAKPSKAPEPGLTIAIQNLMQVQPVQQDKPTQPSESTQAIDVPISVTLPDNSAK